ncbi:MAG: hypothetical protein LBQ93_10495, partial [Treponema sp.]|nr:hypothetical protein [Treponema sp.]
MKTSVFRIYFWLFCLAAAGISLNTCKNPIGLGAGIDTSAPVVSINTEYGAAPGSYLRGGQRFFINATDDSGVAYVTVAYWYNIEDINGNLIEQGPISGSAVWDAEKECYTFDFDTSEMADGNFKAVISAADLSGKKTVTPELVYIIKNKPPSVSMQIPRPTTAGSALDNNFPAGVVTDNYLMGVFEDMAGVAPGYPWIKLWKEGEAEPGTNGADYSANAGWKGACGERDRGNGWVTVDTGFVESEKGERGGSFRYYLRNRTFSGEEYPIGEGEHLEAGRYNVKIIAVDILGSVLEWPRGAYTNEPDFMTIELLASGTPPDIKHTLDPDRQSHRAEFKISAWATPRGELDADIAEMSIAVNNGINQYGEKTDVVLVLWEGEDQIEKDQWKSIKIDPSFIYYEDKTTGCVNFVNSESEVPRGASYVNFIDGSYSFTITAVGSGGSRGNASFSIYIDSVPPKTGVSDVSPSVSQKTVNGIREWVVNSTVVIEVNSTDNRGSASDSQNSGYMKFKYLLLRGDDDPILKDFALWDKEGTLAEYLYQRTDARFFDDVRANPVSMQDNGKYLIHVAGSDGAYKLTLQTHKYSSETKYKLWMYLTAMDSAENTNCEKICLIVDQDTDKPNVAVSHGDFLNGNSFITIKAGDDDGLTANSVFYRYAKNESDKIFAQWMPLPAAVNGDGKTVTINDLSMLKIACDILGIAFNPSITMNDNHRNALGGETDSKFLQVRAFDNKGSPPKVYDTDGEIWGNSGWSDFKIDLTPPKIIASVKDEKGNLIFNRDDDKDSFVIPKKEGSYKVFDFAYGDIIENNLLSITVKVNGIDEFTKTYIVPDVIETLPFGMDEPEIPKIIQSESSDNNKNGFAVWKPYGAQQGHIRWRVPMGWIFNKLQDGSHTFEITFKDKVPQITSRLINFYRD